MSRHGAQAPCTSRPLHSPQVSQSPAFPAGMFAAAVPAPSRPPTRRTTRGEESSWTATRKRVEAWDCAIGCIWLETYFELNKKGVKFWDDLEAKVQPVVRDLFSQERAMTLDELVASAPVRVLATLPKPPAHKPPTQPSKFARKEL